jgi:hypothetical protein
VATSSAPVSSSSRDFCRRICFWNWIGLSPVTAWKFRWNADVLMPQERASSSTRNGSS